MTEKEIHVMGKYPDAYSLCSLFNTIFKDSEWRAGIVIKAWEEELQKDKGGLGKILLVLRIPLMLHYKEPLWVVHPFFHLGYVEECGVQPEHRDPVILDQAIFIPKGEQ